MTTNPDEFDAALDLVVSRTKVERYRHLCSEANTLAYPNDRETWRQWIRSEAMSDPSEPAPSIRVDYGTAAAPGGCAGCGPSPLTPMPAPGPMPGPPIELGPSKPPPMRPPLPC